MKRWDELIGRIDEREDRLGDDVDKRREFDEGMNRMRDEMKGI